MLAALGVRTTAVSPALALLAFIAFIGQVGVAVMLPMLLIRPPVVRDA